MDDEKLELIERRLAENITKRVQSQLFRVYTTAGLAVITVLGILGVSVLSSVDGHIRELARGKFEEQRRKIDELFIDSQVRANTAKSLITETSEQLERFRPKAEQLDSTLDRIEYVHDMSNNLSETYQRDIQPLEQKVDALGEQLAALASQMNALNALLSSAPSVDKSVQTKISDNISAVIKQSERIEQSLEQAKNRETVYFQFAGGAREQAVALSRCLKAGGYIVPGEERTTSAIDKKEIRYFHETDKPIAEALVQELNACLALGGYVTRVTLADFSSYAGKKNRQGVMEVWLELPLRRGS